MSLVDFKRIPLYDPTHDAWEPPVFTALLDPGSPTGPHTGIIYEADWGYFTFSQSIEFEYKDSDTKYTSTGKFTLTGVFTINAEMPPPQSGTENLDVNVPPHPEDPVTGQDETRFNELKAKYDNLRMMFATASRGSAPDDVSHYGTALDPRCLTLPDPLRNSGGGHVYARPISLKINETQWPNLISYVAILEEVTTPTCKVTIDDVIMDKGVITITVEKPRLKIQDLTFANSADIYFTGWNSPEYQFSGTLTEVPPSGALSTLKMTGMINNFMDGRVTIGKQLFNGLNEVMYPDLFIDQSSVAVQPNESDQGTKISFSAKE